MIQQTVTDVSDGAYGAPASTRAVTGLDVVTGGYTSDVSGQRGEHGVVPDVPRDVGGCELVHAQPVHAAGEPQRGGPR